MLVGPSVQLHLVCLDGVEGKVAALIRWGGYQWCQWFYSMFAMLHVKDYSYSVEYVGYIQNTISLFFSDRQIAVK